MQTGIYVGGATKEAIGEARKAISLILGSGSADAVKIEALKSLVALSAAPTNTTIQDSVIDGSSHQHTYAAPASEPEPEFYGED